MSWRCLPKSVARLLPARKRDEIALPCRQPRAPLDKAMHVAVKGCSAVGKSQGRRRVLEFFPPEAVITRLCREKALLYFKDDFAHKVLSMGEAISPDETKFQDYNSAGTLKRKNTPLPCRAEAARWHARDCHYHQKWPGRLHGDHDAEQAPPGERNPHVVGGGQCSPEQTKRVLSMVAKVEGLNKERVAVDFAPWHDFQRWLAAGERRVFVPFAAELADLIPPKAVRLRRDLGQLLRAIKAHALLHRDHRARSNRGSIVATIDEDYAAVLELLADLLATTAEVKTRKAVKETVRRWKVYSRGMAAMMASKCAPSQRR